MYMFWVARVLLGVAMLLWVLLCFEFGVFIGGCAL